MKHRYLVFSENCRRAVVCRHAVVAELASFGIGLMTWFEANPQRVSTATLGWNGSQWLEDGNPVHHAKTLADFMRR